MSISSLSKRNVNVNVDADAVGKVGKNEIGFLWFFCGRGGWMDVKGIITFFGARCLYAAIYLERLILGEIWDGGDSWVGLDYY